MWLVENWVGLVQAVADVGTLAAAFFAWRSVKGAQRIRQSELSMERVAALQRVLEAFDGYAYELRNDTIYMRSQSEADSSAFTAALRSCVEELPLCRAQVFQHIPPSQDEVCEVLKRSRLKVGAQVGDPESESDVIMAMRGELLCVLDDLRYEAFHKFKGRPRGSHR